MANTIPMTHPKLDGRTIQAKSEAQAKVLEKSGWERKDESAASGFFDPPSTDDDE